MKKFISLCLIALMLVGLSFSVAATSSVNYKIDNDTIDNTCYNTRYGFSTYMTAAAYYNGDARRTPSVNTSNYYEWKKYTGFFNNAAYNPIYMTVGTYLDSSYFTDTAAKYYVIQRDGGYRMFNKNQNTAPSGWSYQSYTINVNYSTPGGYSVFGVYVSPSGTGSGSTGADGISINASTN